MTGFTSRRVYAAAHVVADPAGGNGPGRPAVLDWDATLRFRHHLWSLGFGVADAMDTAQRGMGLDWAATQILIRRSGKEARSVEGRSVPSLLACGAGTDQLPAGPHDLSAIRSAYREQVEVVQEAGARVILMASRALAASARSADDYMSVYSELIEQTENPVILHWLGAMFDPALSGYWGSDDIDEATATVLSLIRANPEKVDGIKVSLLDADHEVRLRRALPAGVRLYTGDDFHYPELIKGDAAGHSDAFLGILDGIAQPAAKALRALDDGDLESYDALMDPTVALSRHIFRAPTFHYKTGLVFLAYLNGHQDHFRLVGGLESGRDAEHLRELHRLALPAGALDDPDLAAARLEAMLG